MDPARFLRVRTETVIHKAMSMLAEIREGRRDIADFIEIFGHRAPHDYELAQPRYRENLQELNSLIDRAESAGSSDEPEPQELPSDAILQLDVKRAGRFQVLKEDAKHHCLRQFASLRRALLEIDKRLGLSGGIFYLSLEEVSRLTNPEFLHHAQKRITQRREETRDFDKLRLPSQISIDTLERMDSDGVSTVREQNTEKLRGIKVAGRGEIVGPVQVIHDPSDIDSFRKGHVLVARFTDPTWTPLFNLARGIVTDVGSWLSHAAIVAREYNITAIVGATGSSAALKTGQLVRLKADGTVEKMENRRSVERISKKSPTTVIIDGQETEALLSDLSHSGALVKMNAQLKPGQSLILRITKGSGSIHAEVVRSHTDNHYGVRFDEPVSDLQTP